FEGVPSLFELRLPSAGVSRAQVLEAGTSRVSKARIPSTLRTLPLGRGFCRLRRGDRQRHPHRRASSDGALDTEQPAVRLDDVFDDRQAEPGPAELSRTRAIDAIEALREPWNVLFGDADAVVADRDLHGWRLLAVERAGHDAYATTVAA